MSSSAEIANIALLKLGSEESLLALTDNTVSGRVMNRLFNHVRDSELRRYPWKFALKRDSILALVDSPAWGYERQFPLPSDLLSLVQVNEFYTRGLTQRPPWSVEDRKILTNLGAPLKVRYVRQVTNSGELDPLFVEAFACKLAYEGCEKITQSNTKKDMLGRDYLKAMKEAIRCDAIESPPDGLPWGSWLDSREGGDGLYADASAYPYLSGSAIL